jgi:hypothetical protein
LIKKEVILGNIHICIYVAKLTICKQRNKIKYQNILFQAATLFRIFKAELKENPILRQKYYHNTSLNIDNENKSYDSKIELINLLIKFLNPPVM